MIENPYLTKDALDMRARRLISLISGHLAINPFVATVHDPLVQVIACELR